MVLDDKTMHVARPPPEKRKEKKKVKNKHSQHGVNQDLIFIIQFFATFFSVMFRSVDEISWFIMQLE